VGWFSDAWDKATDVVKDVVGIGGSGDTDVSNSTTTQTTVNPVTNVNIDMDSMAKILGEADKETALLNLEGDRINSQTALINAELDRQQEEKNNLNNIALLDGYLENAKNGLILFGIIGTTLYMYKKGK